LRFDGNPEAAMNFYGEEDSRGGWLKDTYGRSWQIIPSVLGEMLQGKDAEKAKRGMHAMRQMGKIEMSRLQQAYDPA